MRPPVNDSEEAKDNEILGWNRKRLGKKWAPIPGIWRCKWVILGVLGGTKKWHLGCPNQNSKTTFQYKYPPLNPHLDTLGTIEDPGKVIVGHFIYFGHLPIDIPIEAEK